MFFIVHVHLYVDFKEKGVDWIWARMAGLAVHLKKRFFVKARSWYSKHKNDGVYWVPRLFVFVLSFFYTMEIKAYPDQQISPKAHFI